MMLWLARASLAACAADENPDAGAAGTPAACMLPALGAAAWPTGLGELAELPCEQPASSRAAPDISPAHVSAVVRSGPRKARARAEVFRPLGRIPPGARFRRSGHGPITDCLPRTHGPGPLARAG